MKIIWTFTLLMIPGVMSSISVTGYSGGGVNITCRYDRKYKDNAKYFCKGWLTTTCSDLIKTETKDKWVHSGRFSLYDDTRAAVFNVTIRNLSEQDSGMYQCASDISRSKDSYTEVNLKVITDIPKTALPPPSSSSPSPSSLSSSTSSSSSSSSSSSPPPSSLSSSSSSSSSSPSPSSPPPSSSSSASSSSSVRTPLSTGSSLIVPLVLVLLVLIFTGLSLLFLCKKHQSQGGDSSSQAGAGKHDLVSHTGCDYEDIEDTQKQLPTNPSDSSNTVYATAQLPTTPSDSSNTVYATAQLPTNPFDSSNSVYATAQLPTNPSDSSNYIYSTVQEPTGDSQILITSANDRNYSVVNFQNKADCPDSISLRNNQDYSEYAAVNHLTA